MPVLENIKQEMFCQGLCTDLPQVQVYLNAGYSKNGADAGASKLAKRPHIIARVAEIRGKVQTNFAKIAKLEYPVSEIADRAYRVAVLGELAERMVVELRAETDLKGSVGLLRELREYHKQAGIELGTWEEKRDVTVRPASGIDYSKVPLERIQASLEKMKEARAMLAIEAAPGSVEEIKPGPV